MKKTTLAVAATALATSPLAVQGQDFQMEAGLEVQSIEFDRTDNDETAIGFDFTYHIQQVRTRQHVLAEAPFLERSTNLFADYKTFDEADTDNLNLGGQLYAEDLFAEAIVHRTDNGDSETDLSARVGLFVMPATRLALGYDDRGDGSVSFDAKHVQNLRAGTAINLEGGIALVDDDADTTELDLAGDYYLNRNASVGLMLTHTDNDFDSDTGVGFRGRLFFTPLVSANVAYQTDDFRDTVTLGVNARF